ncbi:MAG TPA: glycosyltransferase, partial [Solirubrobacteraceae bacterium]|nr:glycosyltransferase [Solirubrobacteraceae bacterium]
MSERPVLFVTGHAPPYRRRAFAALHELENVEYALFGGPLQHGIGPPSPGPPEGEGGGESAGGNELPFPNRHVSQHEIGRLAASGRHRAVIASTGGRLALPLAWAGARRAGAPLLLWSSLWAHPRSPAHAISYPLLLRLYRSADALVTYGPHVSAHVRARGARNVHVAPQAVENEFWSAPEVSPPPTPPWPAGADVKFLFAGRPTREKGLGVLIEAWRASGLCAPSAALVLVGVGSSPPWVPAGGAVSPESGGRDPHGILTLDPVGPRELRDIYAAADVLVVPSIATRTFR